MIRFFIIIIILLVFYGYIGWSFTRFLSGKKQWKVLIWGVVLFFCILTPITQFLYYYQINGILVKILIWIVFIAFGFFSLLFIFSLFKDIGVITTESIIKLFKIITGRNNKKSASITNPSRRKFILNSINLGILGLSGSMSVYGLYESRFNLQIKNIKIPFPTMPIDLHGFKIAQISDLHLGLTINHDFIKEVVQKVNSLNADIIVFTGDLADGSVQQLKKDVAPMEKLTAPFGKYFVTGNHEYYSGVEPWLKKVKELGFTNLLNENIIINKNSGKILLAGVTDYNGGRFSPNHISDPFKAIKNSHANDGIKILLAHQPRSVYAGASAGFNLQLSGHTHGGQYFPWNLFVKLQQPFISGLHRYKNTYVYVNQGTGYWGPPLRVGAPPEITLIELVRS
ncbi:MAG: metallophosphoesterase [Calditrichia bacterium]|nr:metallophosphoesterase [Calditrichia bacterium]